MCIATWVGSCVNWPLATFQPTQEPLLSSVFLGVFSLWRPGTRHFCVITAGEQVMNRTTHRQDFHHATANRRRWPARRPAGHWRLVCSLSITYALILSLVGVPVASAQTGPQPGQKDPVSNYNYFPYHDMVAFVRNGPDMYLYFFSADQNLHLNEEFSTFQNSDANQIDRKSVV